MYCCWVSILKRNLVHRLHDFPRLTDSPRKLPDYKFLIPDSHKLILYIGLARLAWVPVFVAICNHHAVFPVWSKFGVCALFALSNGYLGTLVYMLAAGNLKIKAEQQVRWFSGDASLQTGGGKSENQGGTAGKIVFLLTRIWGRWSTCWRREI